MKNQAKIKIPTKDGWLFFYHNDISYLKSDDIYASLFNGSEKYFVNTSLKRLEEILPPSVFFRCHRSYLVNTQKIKRLIKSNSNCKLILENGEVVPVSRNKQEVILKILTNN